MSEISRHFRLWWQPPRKTRDRDPDRSVSFLELFYDLVYVVVIAELAHGLAEHADPTGIAGFAFLFCIVWIAWINGTLYHDLHGNDDVRTRIFTFAQMFTVAGMAVFAHSALGEGSAGFAISYASFQLILAYLWWRTGIHDPDHRPLSQPYAALYFIAAFIVLGSVFVEPPVQHYLWGASLLASMLSPLMSNLFVRGDETVREELERSLRSTASMVERFGLFIIIVLGEMIVGVVRGVGGHHDLTWSILATGGFGIAVAIGLWWLYFDGVSHRHPKPGQAWIFSWMFLHLPLAMGIAALGAMVLNLIENADHAVPVAVIWLTVLGTAAVLVAIVLLMKTIDYSERDSEILSPARRVLSVSVLAILALGFAGLNAVPLLGLMSLFLIVPIIVALRSWVLIRLA